MNFCTTLYTCYLQWMLHAMQTIQKNSRVFVSFKLRCNSRHKCTLHCYSSLLPKSFCMHITDSVILIFFLLSIGPVYSKDCIVFFQKTVANDPLCISYLSSFTDTLCHLAICYHFTPFNKLSVTEMKM